MTALPRLSLRKLQSNWVKGSSGTVAMTADVEQIEGLWEAAGLIVSAIAALDRAGAPHHIAAHLDLAHHQLATILENGGGAANTRHCVDSCH